MFRIMLQKLIHKKWIVLSFLIGNILLVAVAVSHPMYEGSAFQKMLQEEFDNYLIEQGQWPVQVRMSMTENKSSGNADLIRAISFFDEIPSLVNLQEKLQITHFHIIDSNAISLMQRDDSEQKKLKVGSLLSLPEHSEILSGQMYRDEIEADGTITGVISVACMIEKDLLIGEVMEFENIADPAGNPLKIKITGVFTNAEDTDLYWQEIPDLYDDEIFISENLFENYFLQEDSPSNNIRASWDYLLDPTSLKTEEVESVLEKTEDLLRDSYFSTSIETPEYVSILESFQAKTRRVQGALTILQIPILMLIAAFLYMISSQMLGMEQSEISIMKSRGAGKGQILRLYLMQNAFLALISMFFGILLGRFLCKMLGSANAFLEFVQRRDLTIEITGKVWIYALSAALFSILIATLPVLSYSKVTIVNLKQRKGRGQKALWQKLYMDIVLLGIALYGYYSYSKNGFVLMETIETGEKMDPLLYISASLFILGSGLFFLRIQPYLIRFLFVLGKKRWKPAVYASYLQALRTGYQQQFIMLFMILTVSLGIFHATVARTILANAELNTTYLTGADLIVQETWKDNSSLRAVDPEAELVYYEPDYGKYEELEEVEQITRVIRSNGYFNNGKMKNEDVTIMGINTKEFGMLTDLPEGLLDYPYYDYLNAISQYENGILVSMNFKSLLDYRLGDSILYTNEEGKSVSGKIYGFVDYWPGYAPTTSFLNPDDTYAEQNEYLIIANFSTLWNSWGATPYEVWMNVRNDTGFFYDWVAENEITVSYYEDENMNLLKIKNDPMFQGTNGILTMGFIIILILCTTGYLIYWILSIRSRELLFGVLRAMGMKKREIDHMLINEQIFSGIFSIVAGGGIGILSSYLFVPVLQTAYAASDQILPLQLITNPIDLIRLFGIILLVLILVLIVLVIMISRMNITKALKLGED